MKMFGNKNESSQSFEIKSVLTEGLTFKDGNLVGSGDIEINCVFHGNIDIDGDVVIGPVGTVVGDINANAAIIQGSVRGNVKSSDTVRVEYEGQLTGNVECKSFEIAGGGVFSGYCNMPDVKSGVVPFMQKNTADA